MRSRIALWTAGDTAGHSLPSVGAGVLPAHSIIRRSGIVFVRLQALPEGLEPEHDQTTSHGCGDEEYEQGDPDGDAELEVAWEVKDDLDHVSSLRSGSKCLNTSQQRPPRRDRPGQMRLVVEWHAMAQSLRQPPAGPIATPCPYHTTTATERRPEASRRQSLTQYATENRTQDARRWRRALRQQTRVAFSRTRGLEEPP